MLEENFKVRFNEMTPERTVPPWALQNYFQQAAAMDAENLSYGTEELFSEGAAWALISIKFDIPEMTSGMQNIKIKTWHCHSDRIYSRRDFVIYDENGTEKVKGTSLWVIIDLAKRKIAKTPQSMLNSKTEPVKGMEPAALKHPVFGDQKPLTTVQIRTRLEDIDINNHVNNIHFTAWAVEGVPEEIRKKMSLRQLSVNYKTEAKSGENITVKTYAGKNDSFWHILTRDEDGKELSAAYSLWQ